MPVNAAKAILAIDTSTAGLVTGLILDAGPERVIDAVVTDTRAHNEQLMPLIDQLVRTHCPGGYADLSAVIVGCGPGPFTGLRVGMATASALGQALKIPVFGVCSLDAIYHDIRRTRAHGSVLVATDARRKEIYWASYRGAVRTAGPHVVRPEDLATVLATDDTPDYIAIPDELASRLPQALQAIAHGPASPRAGGLLDAAREQFGKDLSAPPRPLVPLYLRRPDAKEPAPAPRSPAIPQVEL